MLLQDQVITLDQAKRLAELGVKAPSLFSHGRGFGNQWEIDLTDELPNWIIVTEQFPAYTVAELAMMMPEELEYKGNKCYIQFLRAYKTWYAQIRTLSSSNELFCAMGDTEAQARGAMLIYLLENNYINTNRRI